MGVLEDKVGNRWLASQARHRFGDVIDAAIAGEPQYVRRRDGREVVVVSAAAFEAGRETFKEFLLTGGYAGDEDGVFDLAVANAREVVGMSFQLSPVLGDEGEVHSGHGHSESTSEEPR